MGVFPTAKVSSTYKNERSVVIFFFEWIGCITRMKFYKKCLKNFFKKIKTKTIKVGLILDWSITQSNWISAQITADHVTLSTKRIMYGCKLKDAAESKTAICLVRLLCASAAIRRSFVVIPTLFFLCFTAASLCMQRLPPSYRTWQTCRNVMNGCSQRRGNGIWDQKNKTDRKCIDLLGQINRWIDSLTDGWVLVGRLSNFPLTPSSLQLCGWNINHWSTYKWWCRWHRCWAAAVCSWISSNISFCVWNLHSCQSKKSRGTIYAAFFPSLSLFASVSGAAVVQAGFLLVFVRTEGTRSGGMTASESCGWQRCCYKDWGDARWPDQAGGCRCGETRETGNQNIWTFALKMGCLHSKLYLERCHHENMPVKIRLLVAQKVFRSPCFR